MGCALLAGTLAVMFLVSVCFGGLFAVVSGGTFPWVLTWCLFILQIVALVILSKWENLK